MSLVPTFSWLLICGALGGLVAGGALTLGYTLGSLEIPEGRRGAAFGWLSGAALFGGAVSPTIAGLLARWDLRGIFYLDTAVVLAVAIGVAVLRDPKRNEGVDESKLSVEVPDRSEWQIDIQAWRGG